jgi:putative redox protein
MPNVSVQWVQGRQFVGTDATGHSVVLSGSKDQGGVKPSQMLLVALASCTGVDVVDIMIKKRQPLSGLKIEVTGESDPDPPWAYRRIRVHYIASGHHISEKALAQAIDLSERKYCSVAATIRGVARITTSFEVVDA